MWEALNLKFPKGYTMEKLTWAGNRRANLLGFRFADVERVFRTVGRLPEPSSALNKETTILFDKLVIFPVGKLHLLAVLPRPGAVGAFSPEPNVAISNAAVVEMV
ncbi:hypothetical protein L596_029684 [Steinernema carpocapsae]|uniref:Uncharacterized protein n=1 Tax=Steinernema carpocapsae TaxID=34508 RepID=A0A4U5LQI1_STECR|nr:hypothetical protein L596_029684 [Steinernema carpocapsae]